MTTQEHKPCICCGKQASDMHHEPPLQAGGSPEWVGHLLPLCRPHHEARHRNEMRFDVDSGGVVWGFSAEGKILFCRPLEERDIVTSPPNDVEQVFSYEPLGREGASDAAIIYWIGCGAEWQGLLGKLMMGLGIHWLYQRYGHTYGQAWYKRAAEMVKDQTGLKKGLNTSDIYRYHHVFRFLHQNREFVSLAQEIAWGSLAEIAPHEHAVDAMEFFAAHKEETGKFPTRQQLREFFGEEQKKPEMCTCPSCGHEHRRKT